MHVNDVFSFLKNYFWHQHIKTIQNVQTILNFNKKKFKFFKNTGWTVFSNALLTKEVKKLGSTEIQRTSPLFYLRVKIKENLTSFRRKKPVLSNAFLNYKNIIVWIKINHTNVFFFFYQKSIPHVSLNPETGRWWKVHVVVVIILLLF